MANSLRFQVEVSADQATGALNALSAAFNQANISSRTSLLGIGKSAKTAGDSVKSLGDRMREFARGERAEARTAGFFVSELAQIVPIGNQAKAALTGLTAALVGGGGVFAAVQLATTALAYFKDDAEQAGRRLKETDDLIRGSQGSWASYTASISGASGALRVFNQEDEKLRSALIQSERALLDEQQASDKATQSFFGLLGQLASTGSAARTAEEQIRRLGQALEINRALYEEARRAEQAALANKALGAIRADEEKARREQEQRDAATINELYRERTRIFSDLSALAPFTNPAEDTSLFGFKPVETPTMFPVVSFGGVTGSTETDRQGEDAAQRSQILGQIDDFNRTVEKKQSTAGHQIGVAFAQAMGQGIAAGLNGPKDAAKTLMSGILGAIVSMIPGPAGAFLSPILSSVPFLAGRASGGSVLEGVPYVVGENGPEVFAPSQSGTIIPNHALGGVTNVYNIKAWDAKSVKDMLESGGFEPIAEVRQRRARDGRSW